MRNKKLILFPLGCVLWEPTFPPSIRPQGIPVTVGGRRWRHCRSVMLGSKFFHSRDAIELRTGGHRPNRYVGESLNHIFSSLISLFSLELGFDFLLDEKCLFIHEEQKSDFVSSWVCALRDHSLAFKTPSWHTRDSGRSSVTSLRVREARFKVFPFARRDRTSNGKPPT